jgi:hypothetical protein
VAYLSHPSSGKTTGTSDSFIPNFFKTLIQLAPLWTIAIHYSPTNSAVLVETTANALKSWTEAVRGNDLPDLARLEFLTVQEASSPIYAGACSYIHI